MRTLVSWADRVCEQCGQIIEKDRGRVCPDGEATRMARGRTRVGAASFVVRSGKTPPMVRKDPKALGETLLAEMRDRENYPGDVTMLLSAGAEGVDDETLWAAVITAVEGAQDDSERWRLADGIIDESIATRPALKARWHSVYSTNRHVRDVFRVMNAYLDELGMVDHGWWKPGSA